MARHSVASKKWRASHRRKPLARIGQVSRWLLMSRSAKPVPSGVWNSSADCARSIRMSACVGPRPPASPFSSAIASSSTVTRQPAFLSCARSASKPARFSFFSAASRSSASGVKGAPGSAAVFSTSPSNASRMSSATSMAAAIRFSGSTGLSALLIARPPRCGAGGPAADR